MPLVLCIGLDSHVIPRTFYSKTDLLCYSTIPILNHIVLNDPLIMLKQWAIMLAWCTPPMHVCLEVAKLIFWSDLHTSISQHIIATYGNSHTCHVQKVSCLSSGGCGISMQLIPHLVGQLLLLFVQVWQFLQHSLGVVVLTWQQTQLTEMWIASRRTLRYVS